jgi:hypothetical protein
VVFKTKITPIALAAPKSIEIPHTMARRIVIVINLSSSWVVVGGF